MEQVFDSCGLISWQDIAVVLKLCQSLIDCINNHCCGAIVSILLFL